MYQTVCFVFSLICLLTEINGQFFGNDPVIFDVESITNCAEKSFWTWNVDIVKINDTFVSVSGNATLDRNFDNSISVVGEFLQFNSKNEWKKVTKLTKKNSCSFLRTMAGQLFVDVCKELGLPNGNCPIPKGFYKLDNRLIDVQSTPLSKFLIGKFKGIIQGFTSQKDTLFCGQVIFKTTKL